MAAGGDISTPRNMGHFVLVIDPDKFVGREMFGADDHALSGEPARRAGAAGRRARDGAGRSGMDGAARRQAEGVPVDPDTVRFLGL